MRDISAKKICETVKNLSIDASIHLPEDVLDSLNQALSQEEAPQGREIIREIINNAATARKEKLPLCQDTGQAVFLIEIGQEVRIIDGSLVEAINEGVSRGYHEGFLRKSVTADPLARKNSGDNTPAIIHTEIVPGDEIHIWLMAKGGGAENRSAIKMFKPTSTKAEISKFIVDTAADAGPDACPPLIVGVGIGGNFETAPLLAKKSLLRPLGQHHSQSDTARWEKELLQEINQTGIGPMGLGGRTTALAVHIERAPCHISSLPVAVNIQCHSHRVKSATL
jgi:fumarate hydratase subunit alpha